MGDISTLLTRAAATPTRGPDLDGPVRKARRRRAGVRLIATALLGAAIAVPAFALLRRHPAEKLHVGTAETTATPAPSSAPSTFRDASHRFSIRIPHAWFRTKRPLEPWLYSPHEILSLATVPLAPSPLPGNQAACPSEIPKVAVDAIGPEGAYLAIYEWIPGEGIYTAEPRPAHAAALHWAPECPLPNGLTARGATFRDGKRDFSVSMILGANAADRRAEIDDALDSFRPDTSPPSVQPVTTTAPTLPSSGSCTATQLRLSLDRYVGSVMDQPAAYFALTDTSPTACTLDGYPQMKLYDTAARLISMRIGNGNAYQVNDPGPHTVTVQPGQSVYFGFGWVRQNPNGDGIGCVYVARVSALVLGTGQWLSTPAALNDAFVCPQSGASVTAIAPGAAFTITTP
jgi:Protein of unknown function (DUF4232)